MLFGGGAGNKGEAGLLEEFEAWVAAASGPFVVLFVEFGADHAATDSVNPRGTRVRFRRVKCFASSSRTTSSALRFPLPSRQPVRACADGFRFSPSARRRAPLVEGAVLHVVAGGSTTGTAGHPRLVCPLLELVDEERQDCGARSLRRGCLLRACRSCSSPSSRPEAAHVETGRGDSRPVRRVQRQTRGGPGSLRTKPHTPMAPIPTARAANTAGITTLAPSPSRDENSAMVGRADNNAPIRAPRRSARPSVGLRPARPCPPLARASGR